MCPTHAIHEGELMLFIDPDECVSCDACRWHCERNAIFPQEELPESLSSWIAINAENAPQLPYRYEQAEPLGFPKWGLRESAVAT